MILSIILALIVGAAYVTFEMITAGKKLKKGTDAIVQIGANRIGAGLIIGAVVGTVNYIAPKLEGDLKWIDIFFYLVMVAFLVACAFNSVERSTYIVQVFCTIAVLYFCRFTLSACADKVASMITWNFGQSFVKAFPNALFWGLTGWVLADFCRFKSDTVVSDEYQSEEEQRNAEAAAGLWRLLMYIVAIIAAIIVISTLFFEVSWSDLFGDGTADNEPVVTSTPVPTEAVTPTPTEAPEVTPWYAWYNPSMLNDEDETNDFNFGFDPAGTEGVTEEMLKDPKFYDADFRERLKVDTALGSATMAWFDANCGTRFLGVFYQSCKEDWAETMNTAKIEFVKDQLLYYRSLDALFAFMDEAKAELEMGKTMKDQMFMNPFTKDGIPDIIVMETPQEKSLFLVYKIKIKGKEVKVAFRTECGYQPTDVQAVMKITPEKKVTPTPTKKPTATPSPTATPTEKPTATPSPTATPTEKPTSTPTTSPTPTPSPSPTPIIVTWVPAPTVTPTPTQTPKKDKTEGTTAEQGAGQNDVTGPGKDTNGPSSIYSTEEKITDSQFMSYQDYLDQMAKLDAANGEQPTATATPTQEPTATPTTSPTPTEAVATPEPTPTPTQDDNGSRLDTPTVIKPVEEKASDGSPITGDGLAWGGLSD